eukprot:761608-Hanusia_phi.AAC.3
MSSVSTGRDALEACGLLLGSSRFDRGDALLNGRSFLELPAQAHEALIVLLQQRPRLHRSPARLHATSERETSDQLSLPSLP